VQNSGKWCKQRILVICKCRVRIYCNVVTLFCRRLASPYFRDDPFETCLQDILHHVRDLFQTLLNTMIEFAPLSCVSKLHSLLARHTLVPNKGHSLTALIIVDSPCMQ
jgi:hypothetical protein